MRPPDVIFDRGEVTRAFRPTGLLNIFDLNCLNRSFSSWDQFLTLSIGALQTLGCPVILVGRLC